MITLIPYNSNTGKRKLQFLFQMEGQMEKAYKLAVEAHKEQKRKSGATVPDFFFDFIL